MHLPARSARWAGGEAVMDDCIFCSELVGYVEIAGMALFVRVGHR
jgi:hypothetical protein